MDLGIEGLSNFIWIGSGGHATVYAADRADGGTVAVKILKASAGSDRDRKNFRREQDTMRELSAHPHIIDLIDSGFTRHNEPFFLMPLMAESVQDLVDRDGPLSWQRAAEIMTDVCAAVGHAHDHQPQVLHRDLKPGNILLDSNGVAHVADFGIAKRADNSSTSGAAKGTLGFMPVELFQGDPATAKSDVYAIGATFSSLVTGQTPFVTGEGDSDAAVLMRVINDPPPDLRTVGVPDRLADLVGRAMAKDPAQRPDSPNVFDEELRFVAGLTHAAEDVRDATLAVEGRLLDLAPPAEPETSSSVRRWVAAAALAAFVVIVAALGVRAATSDIPTEITAGAGEDAEEPAATDGLSLEVDEAQPTSTSDPEAEEFDVPTVAETTTTSPSPTTTASPDTTTNVPTVGASHTWLVVEDQDSNLIIGNERTDELVALGSDVDQAWPSPDGTRILFSSTSGVFNELNLATNLGGSPEIVQVTDFNSERLNHYRGDWSPDGRTFVFSTDVDGDAEFLDPELWLLEIDTSGLTQLTDDDHYDFYPTWSPDGTEIAFVSGRRGDGHEVHIMDVASRSTRQLTTDLGGRTDTAHWAPAGNTIAAHARSVQDVNVRELHLVDPITGAVTEAGDATWYGWDPGGERLAVAEGDQLSLVDLSGNRTVLAALSNAHEPVFSPDGSEITVLTGPSGQRTLVRVDAETGNVRTIGPLGDNHGFA